MLNLVCLSVRQWKKPHFCIQMEKINKSSRISNLTSYAYQQSKWIQNKWNRSSRRHQYFIFSYLLVGNERRTKYYGLCTEKPKDRLTLLALHQQIVAAVLGQIIIEGDWFHTVSNGRQYFFNGMTSSHT